MSEHSAARAPGPSPAAPPGPGEGGGAARSGFDEVVRRLATEPLEAFSPTSYAALAREIAADPGEPDLRVAFLGNVTVRPIAPYLQVHAAREGLRVELRFGGFDQYYQEVLGRTGDDGLDSFDPDLILLVLDARGVRPALRSFASLSTSERKALKDDLLDHVLGWVGRAKERFRGTLLVSSFPQPVRPALGVADLKEEYGETAFYAELNLGLIEALREESRVLVFDLSRLTAGFGAARARDPKLWFLARMPWSEAFLPQVARELVRYGCAVQGRTRKCLVLDLDNTLWGGVVGEDGVAGVKIGPGDPVGEAYRSFQERVKALERRGILLAICSKNNEADALEVFRQRAADMVLAEDDFVARRINWLDKPENLRSLAAELNIGTDSLVFCDDNPVEVEMVRHLMPEVRCVHLEGDPAHFTEILESVPDMEKVARMGEDLDRTADYGRKRQREKLRDVSGSLSDYLEGLETVVTIGVMGPDELPRVHQLHQKTNQFNLTTRRYALGELEAFMAPGSGRDVFWFRARDRFGDLGIIGACVIHSEAGVSTIESLLMSCRAMGRGIETAFLNWLLARQRDHVGDRELRGLHIPTKKNAPVKDLYPRHGFVEEPGDGARTFTLDLETAEATPCGWIEVEG